MNTKINTLENRLRELVRKDIENSKSSTGEFLSFYAVDVKTEAEMERLAEVIYKVFKKLS